jgi:uncharacterized membrane protein YqjE
VSPQKRLSATAARLLVLAALAGVGVALWGVWKLLHSLLGWG